MLRFDHKKALCAVALLSAFGAQAAQLPALADPAQQSAVPAATAPGAAVTAPDSTAVTAPDSTAVTAPPTGATAAGDGAAGSASANPAATSAASAGATLSTPAGSTAAPTSSPALPPVATGTEPVDGPLLEKRRLVLSHIRAAKKQGCGITAYMAEFNRIEEMVRTAQPQTAYAERLDSLGKGLDEQLKRSEILKSQRPAAPVVYQPISHGSASASAGAGAGAGAGPGTDRILDQLRSRYGSKIPDKIPDGLGGLSPDQREKLMNSDLGRQLLKRVLGN